MQVLIQTDQIGHLFRVRGDAERRGRLTRQRHAPGIRVEEQGQLEGGGLARYRPGNADEQLRSWGGA